MHRTTQELLAYADHLRGAPAEVGTLDLVVRRPAVDQREILDECVLDPDRGLVGDNWLDRATSHAIETGRHLEAQLNVMSARMVRFLAESVDDQALAGDQLFFDLDISVANLPTGTRLAIGDDAVIEVTAKPHNGHPPFSSRVRALTYPPRAAHSTPEVSGFAGPAPRPTPARPTRRPRRPRRTRGTGRSLARTTGRG
jgi:hypothetical protein